MAKKRRGKLKLEAGSHYWIALDDGSSFKFFDWLPEGPHLVRLDQIEGEWRIVMLDKFAGTIEIGSDLSKRVCWAQWPVTIWGMPSSTRQEVRITWLSQVAPPPPMPTEMEPG